MYSKSKKGVSPDYQPKLTNGFFFEESCLQQDIGYRYGLYDFNFHQNFSIFGGKLRMLEVGPREGR